VSRLPPFHWWRTVCFLIPAISVYTIALGTLSIASSLVDRSGRFAHRCARIWSWLILATTGVDVRISGLQRVDRGKTYVFAANHQSIYDIPILFSTLPFEVRILAKDSLGRFPFLGWHLSRAGHVLVDRRNPGASVFRQVAQLMRAGVSLTVFPEGTRSVDGSLRLFKAGTFKMAIEHGLPVVPVAIHGSRFVMRKGRLMTCPGRVTLEVFDPVPTTDLTRDDARRLSEEVRRQIAAVVETGNRNRDSGIGIQEPSTS
jgi:1-acyl-sn-glycerol-3-phosphate acyltransferase